MNKPELTYARPVTLNELEELQQEFRGQIMYLAGGDYHPKVKDGKSVLIDLQELELDMVEIFDGAITFGGLVNLQQLGDGLESADMREAISIEAGMNLRNSLSLTNYVKSSNGRSSVQICLNAMEAEYRLSGEEDVQKYSPSLKTKLADGFIEDVRINNPISLAFVYVARSPKDQPVVAVAASKRSDDRIHIACGGSEAMWAEFDLNSGYDSGETTIRDLFKDVSDKWAGAEYQQEVAAVLLSRCLQKLGEDSNTKEEA
jgi:CO/xanthine dehydrogenase FAD-binding subunit